MTQVWDIMAQMKKLLYDMLDSENDGWVSGPVVRKPFFSCSAHKSIKFIIFINTKTLTDESIFLLRTADNGIGYKF